MLDVYCDNELLLDCIINANQPKGNLYPHELALLFYCSIGQIQTDFPKFPNVFTYKLKVDYPVCLLYSLISRGYIKTSSYPENLTLIKVKEIQKFLKSHNIKSSTKRDELINILTLNFSQQQIQEAFPQEYFIPTKLGINELNISGFTITNAYNGWQENNNFTNTKLLSKNDISIINPTINELIIKEEKDRYIFNLLIDKYLMNITSRYIRLPKRSNINIKKETKTIFYAENVDNIEFLYNRKILTFETLSNLQEEDRPFSPNSITAINFDFENETVLCKELIDNHSTIQQTLSEYIDNHCKKDTTQIKHDGIVDYYVSLNNHITYLLLSKYLANELRKIKISIIPKFSNNDFSQNIIISVPESDLETRRFIYFLERKKHLLPPSINKINIGTIVRYFFSQHLIKLSQSQTDIYKYENDLGYNKHCASFISENVQNNSLKYLKNYIFEFPPQAFETLDFFRYYDSANIYTKDIYWEYAISHETELQKQYDNYILDMKERQIIPAKWINEFNLFLLVRNIYSDSMYQYHCDWLGRQSFDIFIPSKNVAIEYQGIQHYEPVEAWGGIQGLIQNQERDKRKREKSAKHNVRVLEWKYTVPVNKENVYLFLQQI